MAQPTGVAATWMAGTDNTFKALGCGRSFVGGISEQLRNFQGRSRATEIVTLHFGAGFRTQNVLLLLGFNTLGRCRLAQAHGKSHHGAGDHTRFFFRARQLVDEASINLDLVERKPLQKT